MNADKYPTPFVAVCALYIAVFFIVFFGFFVPALSANLLEDSGFYVLMLIIFGPMVLLLFYTQLSRFVVLWGKEKALRYIIMIFCIISMVFCAVSILPII